MKILIIQQKMIGDVLTSSILFEALRAKYPTAQLHYVINTSTYPVVENHPFIDRFLMISPDIENSKRHFFKFLKSIRNENYDVVIDVYGKLGSSIMSLFSGAKIKIAYHKSYTSFIFNQSISRLHTPKHKASLAIENRMRLLEPLDIDFIPYQPKIYLSDLEINKAKTLLETSKVNLQHPLFMISVLGSSAIKTYPAIYMASLLDAVVETNPNAQILFNYIPKQKEKAQEIYDGCAPLTQKQIYFDIFGKSLRDFLALNACCDATIGNEGGANNMAKALNIPTFTIFSPYLNKKNWFGELEEDKHTAVHLSDYMDYALADAKQNPADFYRRLKPELIIPKLKSFIRQFN